MKGYHLLQQLFNYCARKTAFKWEYCRVCSRATVLIPRCLATDQGISTNEMLFKGVITYSQHFRFLDFLNFLTIFLKFTKTAYMRAFIFYLWHVVYQRWLNAGVKVMMAGWILHRKFFSYAISTLIKFLRSPKKGHLGLLDYQKSWNLILKKTDARAHTTFKWQFKFNNTSRNNWKP